MKKNYLLIPMLALTFVACDRADHNTTSRSKTEAQDADNTGRNVRDRDMNTITPGDQSESEADRTITQNIRKALVADDQLSNNAKNAKIVTIVGVVTLRGPVETAAEKDRIEKIARSVNNVKRVDNQLEVKRN